jgi:hypothetical protein
MFHAKDIASSRREDNTTLTRRSSGPRVLATWPVGEGGRAGGLEELLPDGGSCSPDGPADAIVFCPVCDDSGASENTARIQSCIGSAYGPVIGM